MRATSVRRPAEPSRASSRVSAVPTLPVAPTTATCRSAWVGRPSSTPRAWASTVAAVKALPFVTPMSVRARSATPPAVTVAVSAPSPTVPLPSATARSTARATRARPSAGDWSRWRAPKGTRTTCPTRSPPISTVAIVYGASGRWRSAVS